MPLVKILQQYDNVEGWGPGDVVDITEPSTLIQQGKVELVDEESVSKKAEKKAPAKKPVTVKVPTKSTKKTSNKKGSK